jgi:hypothetical protein
VYNRSVRFPGPFRLKLGATAAVWLCFLGLPAPTGAAVRGPARLPSADVEAAIAWGRQASRQELDQYVLKVAPTWTLNYDTAFLRIAQLAHNWKQKDMMLSEGDVPPDDLANDVHLYALAIEQPGAQDALLNVNHITMARPGGVELIQPKRVTQNLIRARRRDDYKGVARIAQSVTAVFHRSELSPGNEIRILFDGGARAVVKVTKEMVDKR